MVEIWAETMAEGMEKSGFQTILKDIGRQKEDGQFDSGTEEFRKTQVFIQISSFGETFNVVWRL